MLFFGYYGLQPEVFRLDGGTTGKSVQMRNRCLMRFLFLPPNGPPLDTRQSHRVKHLTFSDFSSKAG